MATKGLCYTVGMEIIITIIILLGLFYLIGKSADVIIINAKILGTNLGIRHFWLGLILGLLTSIPELVIGLKASWQGYGQLPFGNLMGGVLVMLGLIAGLSAVVNKGLDVSESFRHRELGLMALFISLPLWLMFDGELSNADGLILMIGYIFCVFYFIHVNYKGIPVTKVVDGSSNLRSLLYAILGLIAVVILAKLILDISLPLIKRLILPPWWVGLVFFSLGTNLPEITLAFRSWRSGVRDISFGNLVGSSFANSLIVGLLAFAVPITMTVDLSYYLFMGIMLILLIGFVGLSYTGKHLSVREGWILVSIYCLFLLSQIVIRGV